MFNITLVSGLSVERKGRGLTSEFGFNFFGYIIVVTSPLSASLPILILDVVQFNGPLGNDDILLVHWGVNIITWIGPIIVRGGNRVMIGGGSSSIIFNTFLNKCLSS